MSSDSSSSTASSDTDFDDSTYQLLWDIIADVASTAPPGTSTGFIFGQVTQKMQQDHNITITMSQIQHILKIARGKKRHKKSADKAAHSKQTQHKPELQKYNDGLDACKTRIQRMEFMQNNKQPSSSSSEVTRTVSVATNTAMAALEALDDLNSRKKAAEGRKDQSKDDWKEEKDAQPRRALADISNTLTIAITGPASSSPSPSSASPAPNVSNLSLSTPSSPASAMNISVSSAPSNPVIPPSPPSSTFINPFPLALAPARTRITAQNSKKEIKRALAEDMAQKVRDEQERRKTADRVLEKTERMADCMLNLSALLELMIRSQLKLPPKNDSKEEDENLN